MFEDIYSVVRIAQISRSFNGGCYAVFRTATAD
jgi:hypothetical protein